MADRGTYEDDPVLAPFIDAIRYFVTAYFRKALHSNTLRDEDVVFPATTDNYLMEINGPPKSLLKISQELSEATKTCPECAGLIKIVHSLLLMTGKFITNEPIQEAPPKKGKKPKQLDIAELLSEGVKSLKIHSEAITKELNDSTEALFPSNMVSALCQTVNLKKFQKFSDEQTIDFFEKFSSHFS